MLHLKPHVWPWPGVTHKDRLEPSPACGGILIGGSVCVHLLREEGREVCRFPRLSSLYSFLCLPELEHFLFLCKPSAWEWNNELKLKQLFGQLAHG